MPKTQRVYLWSKTGMTSGILIDSGKLLHNSPQHRAERREPNQNCNQIEEMHDSKQGNMAIDKLIPPDKRPNIFSILKTHKKTLVSFITIHRKTWIKKPIIQVRFSTKILKGFTFTMPSVFFCQVPAISNLWQITGKNNKWIIWIITIFLSLLFYSAGLDAFVKGNLNWAHRLALLILLLYKT